MAVGREPRHVEVLMLPEHTAMHPGLLVPSAGSLPPISARFWLVSPVAQFSSQVPLSSQGHFFL